MSKIDKTIKEREKSHGNFAYTAQLCQDFKKILHGSKNWNHLTPLQRETLESVTGKISRILSGDPNHRDSYHDIAGYAALCEQLMDTEDVRHK